MLPHPQEPRSGVAFPLFLDTLAAWAVEYLSISWNFGAKDERHNAMGEVLGAKFPSVRLDGY